MIPSRSEMDTGPPLKQRLVVSRAAVVSHAAKSIDMDPSAAFTQDSLILAHVRSRLCRGISYSTIQVVRQMKLTEIAFKSSKSRARSSSLRMKVGPAVSSTNASLVACCEASSVGVESPREDGSVSGVTRVSCSNAFANMLFCCDPGADDDPFASLGPRRSL